MYPRNILSVFISVFFLVATLPSFATTKTFCGEIGELSPDETLREYTLSISESGTIRDLNVSLNLIKHQHVGGLIITLAHGVNQVTFLDQPGLPSPTPHLPETTKGCSSPNIPNVIFDDEAVDKAEKSCNHAGSPAYQPNGSYRPNHSFSVFKNRDIQGTWTLSVQDKEPSSPNGEVKEWCLIVDVILPNNPHYTSNPIPSDTIPFGEVDVDGLPKDKIIEISNEEGQTDLEVRFKKITGDKEDFAVEPSTTPLVTIPAGKSDFITVKCDATTFGERQATLELTTNDPDHSNIKYDLSCTGLGPEYHSVPVAPGDMIRLGDTMIGLPVKKSFKINNIGNVPLIVEDIWLMQEDNWEDFKITAPSNFTLPKNSGGNLIVEIQCTPSALGPHRATLVVKTELSDFRGLHEYPLQCEGVDPDVPPPVAKYHSLPHPSSTITFNTWEDTPVDQTLFITETGITKDETFDLTINKVEIVDEATNTVSNYFFIKKLPNLPVTILNNDPLTSIGSDPPYYLPLKIICTPAPNGASIGNFSPQRTATLKIITQVGDPTQRIEQTYTYPLQCNIKPKFAEYQLFQEVMNGILVFLEPNETFYVGQSQEQKMEPGVWETVERTFYIRNTGEADLSVDFEGINGAEFNIKDVNSLFPATIPENQQLPVTVQCTPNKEGINKATLKLNAFNLAPAKNQPHPFSYQLECLGIKDRSAVYNSVPVSPGKTINLGYVPVNTTQQMTLTIVNEGDSLLWVDSAKPIFSGPQAKAFQLIQSPLPVFIGKGKGSNLQVQCSPQESGEHRATLNLITNGKLSNKPPYDEDLGQWLVQYDLVCTNNNVQPGFDSLPAPNSTLGFGTVTIGERATRTIAVEEVGNGDLTITSISLSGTSAETYGVNPVLPFTIVDGGDEQAITIYCQPAVADLHTAKLELTTNDPSNPKVFYNLECQATSKTSTAETSQLTVQFTGNGEGLVTSDPEGISCKNENAPCQFSFAPDSTVTLIPTPKVGSQFKHWHGDCDDKNQITIAGQQSCTAHFEKLSTSSLSATLSVTVSGQGGTITSDPPGIICGHEGDVCVFSYDKNTPVTLTATVVPSHSTDPITWHFRGWSGCKQASDITTEVLMTSDQACQATFASEPSPQPTSTTCPNTSIIYVNQNASGNETGLNWKDAIIDLQNALAIATRCESVNQIWVVNNNATSQLIDGVVVYGGFNGTETQLEERNTSTQPTHDNSSSSEQLITLTVIKTGASHEVSINSDIPGIRCGDQCSQNYPYGTEIILQADDSTDFQFMGWRGNHCQGTDNFIKISMTADTTCEALFESIVTPAVTDQTTPSLEETGPETIPTTEQVQVVTPPVCRENQARVINVVCNLEGQTRQNITVSPSGNISDVKLTGTNYNQGWISNAQVQPGAILFGGILSGVILNQGTLSHIEFRGIRLVGGGLTGLIINNSPIGGSIENVSLDTDAHLLGGKLVGEINSSGTIEDVFLATNSRINGGVVTGTVIGQSAHSSVLENVTVTAGSCLENVKLGQNVHLEEGVTIDSSCPRPSLRNTTLPNLTPQSIINDTVQGNGKVFTDITIAPTGHLINAVLAGTITNLGAIATATLTPGSFLTGGLIKDQFINQGTVKNVELNDATLSGGQLAGQITSTNSLIQDVTLAPNTQIEGGQLQGNIIGDINYPAILNNVTILAGSHLKHVILGDGVQIAAGVTLGEGVQRVTQANLISETQITSHVQAEGQTLQGVTVTEKGNLSNATLAGTITNQGVISHATLTPDSFLSGGVLMGQIISDDGIIADVHLDRHSHIIGGEIQGQVQGQGEGRQRAQLDLVTIAPNSHVANVIIGQAVVNTGTITDFELRGAVLEGGTLGGTILSTRGGTIGNVRLAPGAKIIGGNIVGQVIGDPKQPARLEGVTIAAGSSLNNVVIDLSSATMANNVQLGTNVQLINQASHAQVIDAQPSYAATALRKVINSSNQVTYVTEKILENSKAPHFSAQLRTPQGVQPNHAFISYIQAEEIKLSATIQVASEHVGQPANILMVLLHQFQENHSSSMRQQDEWVTWDLDPSTLKIAQTYQKLPSKLTVAIFDQVDFSKAPGEYTVYVGYQLAKEETIIYNGITPIHFFVESAPPACMVYGVHDEGRSDTQFLKIDLSYLGLKGVMTPLGPLYPQKNIEGMALHWSNPDVLYGTSGTPAASLYTIDRLSGEILSQMPLTVPEQDFHFSKVASLAVNWNDKTAEQLWAWAEAQRHDNWMGLIQIAPNSGMTTLVKQFTYEDCQNRYLTQLKQKRANNELFNKHYKALMKRNNNQPLTQITNKSVNKFVAEQCHIAALAWSYNESQQEEPKLYAAGGRTLWVYDHLDTQKLELACVDVVPAGEEIEGLEMQPNGYMLLGIDHSKTKETSIIAYDPHTCTAVKKRVFSEKLNYHDIESIVWPVDECFNQSWLWPEEGKQPIDFQTTEIDFQATEFAELD